MDARLLAHPNVTLANRATASSCHASAIAEKDERLARRLVAPDDVVDTVVVVIAQGSDPPLGGGHGGEVRRRLDGHVCRGLPLVGSTLGRYVGSASVRAPIRAMLTRRTSHPRPGRARALRSLLSAVMTRFCVEHSRRNAKHFAVLVAGLLEIPLAKLATLRVTLRVSQLSKATAKTTKAAKWRPFIDLIWRGRQDSNPRPPA